MMTNSISRMVVSQEQPDDTKHFLDILFGNAVSPEAMISIWPKGGTATFHDSIESAAKTAESMSGDIYHGCGLYRPGIAKGRGKADDVTLISSLWADVDCGEDKSKKRFPDKDTAVRWLKRSLPLLPSLLVDSGGGIHAYWLLTEAIPAVEAVPLLKGWGKYLQSVANEHQVQLDSVFDLSRVLRPVGSFNCKRGKEPVILLEDSGKRYEPDDFREYIDEVLEPPVQITPHDVDLSGVGIPAPDMNQLLKEIRSALQALKQSRCDDYEQWIRVGMAIHAAANGSSEGLLLWDEWSQGSDKYDPDGCAKKWSTFESENGVQGATLFGMANKDYPGWQYEEIQPSILHPVPDWTPFPVDVFPEVPRRLIQETAASVGSNPALSAMACLGAMSVAVGNAYVVELKKGWTAPAVLWAAAVMGSGHQKSPSFQPIMRPLWNRQDAYLAEFIRDKENYDNEVAANKGKPSAGENEPIRKRILVSDCTLEKLALTLQENARGVLLHRDELSGWVGGFNKYRNGVGGDESQWLEMYDAGRLDLARKTTSSAECSAAFVSVVGTIQPGILAKVITDDHRECGLAGRLLVCMPPSTPRKWHDETVGEDAEKDWKRVIDWMFTLQPQSAGVAVEPCILPLLSEAQERFIQYVDEHGAAMENLDDHERAAWSKLEGAAARFALIFHVCRWAENCAVAGESQRITPISSKAMEDGIRLARWFADEYRRVWLLLGESKEIQRLRRLTSLIQRRGGVVRIREWVNSRRPKTREEAERELNDLVEAGQGRIVYNPMGKQGGQPSPLFILKRPSRNHNPYY